MTVLNELDRSHLALDATSHVSRLQNDAATTTAADLFRARLVEHRGYVDQYGVDMPDVRDWRWDSDM